MKSYKNIIIEGKGIKIQIDTREFSLYSSLDQESIVKYFGNHLIDIMNELNSLSGYSEPLRAGVKIKKESKLENTIIKLNESDLNKLH